MWMELGGGAPDLDRRLCVHSRGGVCELHGPGAKLKWKPDMRARRARGGGVEARGGGRGGRIYRYVCDLGPNGNAVRQQRLSFVDPQDTGDARNSPISRRHNSTTWGNNYDDV